MKQKKLLEVTQESELEWMQSKYYSSWELVALYFAAFVISIVDFVPYIKKIKLSTHNTWNSYSGFTEEYFFARVNWSKFIVIAKWDDGAFGRTVSQYLVNFCVPYVFLPFLLLPPLKTSNSICILSGIQSFSSFSFIRIHDMPKWMENVFFSYFLKQYFFHCLLMHKRIYIFLVRMRCIILLDAIFVFLSLVLAMRLVLNVAFALAMKYCGNNSSILFYSKGCLTLHASNLRM